MSGLIYPFKAFTPSSDNAKQPWWDPILLILQHYCECLERLSELETSPNQPILHHIKAFSEEKVIQTLLDFVERGTLPPDYEFHSDGQDEEEGSPDGTEEQSSKESTASKTMGQCKASVLKFVTSLCWEIPYETTSPIWRRIRDWLADKNAAEREDLLGSALICFANGIRDSESRAAIRLMKGDTAIGLLNGADSLLPVVIPLLSPDTRVVLQHSVIGLVKNLANPTENKAILGEAGVIDRLIKMEVFSDKRDMVGTIQGGSAGLLKLLCLHNGGSSDTNTI
jgi:hypothetical protein